MRLSSPYPLVIRPVSGALTLDLVHDLRCREARDRHRLFLAEGVRFVSAALSHRTPIAGLVICPNLVRSPLAWSLVEQMEAARAPILRATPPEYRALSPGVSNDSEGTAASHQGLLLVARQVWEPLPATVKKSECWIGVESIQTFGNLGTLLRSGDASGATGLLVFDRSTEGAPSGPDPYDPLAVRASMGSIFAHRMIRTTHSSFRKWARRTEISVVGATPEAEVDYRSITYRKAVVLMLGHERSGLSDGQRNTCDRLVRIPMVGSPDSLNLAMAGTLMLYEVLNQRCPAERP
jgi:TrmH family RNA methyltransferase